MTANRVIIFADKTDAIAFMEAAWSKTRADGGSSWTVLTRSDRFVESDMRREIRSKLAQDAKVKIQRVVRSE